MKVFRFVSVAMALLVLLSLTPVFGAGGQEPGEEQAATQTARTGKYGEAPELAAMVKAGTLPPVDERLPENPMVVKPVESVGRYDSEPKKKTP